MIALGKLQAVISEETAIEIETNQGRNKEPPRFRRTGSSKEYIPQALSARDGNGTCKIYLSQII